MISVLIDSDSFAAFLYGPLLPTLPSRAFGQGCSRQPSPREGAERRRLEMSRSLFSILCFRSSFFSCPLIPLPILFRYPITPDVSSRTRRIRHPQYVNGPESCVSFVYPIFFPGKIPSASKWALHPRLFKSRPCGLTLYPWLLRKLE